VALAADLRTWRLACGRPADRELVFPGVDGRTVTREAWKSWTRRTWDAAWKAAGLSEAGRSARVYDLRHSYVSLLLAEGRTIHYVAAQAGHDPQLTLSTYGHLLAEYAEADRIDAEQEIVKARAALARSPRLAA
jgi:integrase